MNIYLIFLLIALALALAAVAAVILVPRTAPIYQGFEDISSTKSLLTNTFGPEIIWNDLYKDAYTMQDRYVSTLQKAVPETNAVDELERLAGAPTLKCLPAEMERTLSRTPATSADARIYLNCLPSIADFERLVTFLSNELQTSLTNSKNALAGVVEGPLPVGIEGFAACCDATPIIALKSTAAPRKMSANKRTEIGTIIATGLAAITEIDRMNTAAQDGTLPFTPPPLLS
jgi:hypothetical protein